MRIIMHYYGTLKNKPELIIPACPLAPANLINSRGGPSGYRFWAHGSAPLVAVPGAFQRRTSFCVYPRNEDDIVRPPMWKDYSSIFPILNQQGRALARRNEWQLVIENGEEYYLSLK